jgi:hypothetical protein
VSTVSPHFSDGHEHFNANPISGVSALRKKTSASSNRLGLASKPSIFDDATDSA